MDKQCNDAGNEMEDTSKEESAENHNESKETDDDETKGLPIDRGWAWVILAASVFYLFLFGGIRKNFGIFFVAFQTRFNSSASMTSLLSTVQCIVRSFVVLIVMTVGLHVMSNRTLVMIGAVFVTVSNVITAYSQDIRVLFFSFGFLEPIGICMIHPPVLAILAEYFNKRRGMANSLAFCGASMGGLIMAPIMTALFEYYGYTGTLMIVAGMLFHIMITGSLLRPIKTFERRVKRAKKHDTAEECEQMLDNGEATCDNKHTREFSSDTDLNNKENNANYFDKHELVTKHHDSNHVKYIQNDKVDVHDVQNSVLDNPASRFKKENMPYEVRIRTNSYDNTKHNSSKYFNSHLLPRPRSGSTGRERTFSENSHVSSLNRSLVALYASVDDIGASVGNIAQFRDSYTTRNHDESIQRSPSEHHDKNKSKTIASPFKNAIVKLFKIMFDLSLFKKPLFPFFLCMSFIVFSSCIITPVFIPPHAQDLGLSGSQIGIMMSVMAGGDFVGRLTLAFVSDKKFIRRTTVLASALAVVGSVHHFVRFFTSFEAMIGFCIVIGLTCGLYNALYGVILVDYLTLAKYKSTLGFTFMCHGIGSAVVFPIAGSIRDSSGSYVTTYHLLGSMLLVGALLMGSIPYVHKWQTKDDPQPEETVDV